ncbi:glycosyltransferase family 2 protein [Chryseobacterium sp. T20]|uniref:glycosyltransferase family 2 protein n=1 Tax=Chryseobacterium sp. T20 TaxID=3395375 RepID=UPI0039BD2F21
MNPKISVIVPCYNQARFLDESLQSVLDQTYENWECIIVNDGSPDNTAEVADKWVKKDNRFRYLYKENGGLSSARNAALEIKTGDYIQFLDSDDILVQTKFSDSLNLIQEKEAIVVSNFCLFDDSDKQKLLPPFCKLSQDLLNFESILYQWDFTFTIPIHCGFFPKSLFETIRFNENLKAKEDWLFWIQIAQKNINFIFLDAPLALYRKHARSMSRDRKHMIVYQMLFYNEAEKVISNSDFKKLLLRHLNTNYNKVNELTIEIRNLKESRTFKLFLSLKKIIEDLGLLHLSKKIFRLIRKPKK